MEVSHSERFYNLFKSSVILNSLSCSYIPKALDMFLWNFNCGFRKYVQLFKHNHVNDFLDQRKNMKIIII
jgi:hypothetical protein